VKETGTITSAIWVTAMGEYLEWNGCSHPGQSDWTAPHRDCDASTLRMRVREYKPFVYIRERTLPTSTHHPCRRLPID
jgi:hypothetical protein